MDQDKILAELQSLITRLTTRRGAGGPDAAATGTAAHYLIIARRGLCDAWDPPVPAPGHEARPVAPEPAEASPGPRGAPAGDKEE